MHAINNMHKSFTEASAKNITLAMISTTITKNKNMIVITDEPLKLELPETSSFRFRDSQSMSTLNSKFGA